MTFSRIAMIDAVVVVAMIALSVWKHAWMWYVIPVGLLVCIAVFVVLNKQCLRKLSCPRCQRHVEFEAGEGFVCKNCRIGWEMG